MTEREQAAHAAAIIRVRQALTLLDRLQEEVRAAESIAIARARLADWLDANEGRWVT